VDVADEASVSAAADRAVEALGGLDVWLNVAGIYPVTPALEMTDEEWRRVLDINLTGTFYGAREAARRMTAAGPVA
jgi:NAD(P)-dependent dehydrogenase (short-subunit alcohol dehydrogenase family)